MGSGFPPQVSSLRHDVVKGKATVGLDVVAVRTLISLSPLAASAADVATGAALTHCAINEFHRSRPSGAAFNQDARGYELKT